MSGLLRTILVLGVIVLKSSRSYNLYPGIFDPNPYIPRMSPQVLKITASTLYDPVYGSDSDGVKDGETGYVKSNSEKGEGGYHHVETFQTKGGDDYEHEHESGYGESKNDADYEDHHEPSVRKRDNNRDLKNQDRNYEVIEELSNDHKNPNQHTTYGVKLTKPSKRLQIPEFGTRLTLPKKTTLKQNHNGYETVIYHGHENESSEKGYDRKKFHKVPSQPKATDQTDDESDDEEQEQEQGEEEKDTHEQESEKDDDQEHFGNNYNNFKYDDDFGDFSKDFNGDDGSEEIDSEKDGRSGNPSKSHYDYDEEVDREEVDEAANEDRYHGGGYDDDDDDDDGAGNGNDDYGGHNNRRQYDYEY